MVKPTSSRKRALALMVDGLVALSIVMTLVAILNSAIPETEVKPMSMQLMPPKMLSVFFYTTTAITFFLGFMVFFAPHLPGRGGSLGHRVAKIRLVTLKGENVSWFDSFCRFLTTVFRAGLVFFGGPVLATIGQSVTVSVLALIWALILLLPIPARRSPFPVTVWQILGNYIFIDRPASNDS